MVIPPRSDLNDLSDPWNGFWDAYFQVKSERMLTVEAWARLRQREVGDDDVDLWQVEMDRWMVRESTWD